jgi:predicted nucleic acid-binding protein
MRRWRRFCAVSRAETFWTRNAAKAVRQVLSDARLSVSSDITLVECDRVLLRAAALAQVSELTATSLRRHFETASRDWSILRVTPAIVARARQPFPEEPIRTLDALHVASALHASNAVPDLALLSLDARIRRVASGLGFELVP